MEITRTLGGEFVSIELVGRLDGYWSDHLTSALTDAVREGHHHIRLDCSGVNFLSSAGIGVLMKFHQELARINGTFLVVNASAPVSTVLRITRLAQFLVEPPWDGYGDHHPGASASRSSNRAGRCGIRCLRSGRACVAHVPRDRH